MKVTKIKVKKLSPINGLIGFCSFVIDGWLYIGNIAIFQRKDCEAELRLVFPEKKVNEETENEKVYKLFYPLSSDKYYELEQLIRAKFFDICK